MYVCMSALDCMCDGFDSQGEEGDRARGDQHHRLHAEEVCAVLCMYNARNIMHVCMHVCMHICRGRFIPEILEELDLVEQECVYREIVADLVTHISSQVRVGLGACVGSPYEMQVHV